MAVTVLRRHTHTDRTVAFAHRANPLLQVRGDSYRAAPVPSDRRRSLTVPVPVTACRNYAAPTETC